MHDQAETAQRFDAIIDSYYKAWFRYHPEVAVDAGYDDYAGSLTPYGDDDIGALETLNRELMFSLEELDAEALDADRQVDYELAWSGAAMETERLLEADWRHRDPERYLPVNAVHQLLISPVCDFEAALHSRLAAIPDYLRGARQQLDAQAELIPPLWLISALETARQGSRFIASVPEHPRLQECSTAIPDLSRLASDAADALQHFANCIERDLGPRASGDFACGERYFSHILNYRHFLDANPQQVHALGVELFEDTLSRLRECCMTISGNDDIDSLNAKLAAKHPPADQLLASYRDIMSQAKLFVIANDIVSIPAEEQLTVIETPSFLRHEIPFAAYHEPRPNDARQQAYYYVTSCEEVDCLAHHNYAAIQQTCVHEAWPGHHLQFVTANQSAVASTLPRLLNPSATLYEGWALYCEQMMLEQGFGSYPEQEFIMLRDRLWRALRILLDVELHCQGLSVDTAADRMMQSLGMPRAQAMAELTWYSRSPGVPLGYATGWSLINALRDELQATEGEDFILKSFHDRLLASGSMSLPMVIRRQFGDQLWADIEKAVFHLED
jgi:uncharacterized protein (DUF885 family)